MHWHARWQHFTSVALRLEKWAQILSINLILVCSVLLSPGVLHTSCCHCLPCSHCNVTKGEFSGHHLGEKGAKTEYFISFPLLKLYCSVVNNREGTLSQRGLYILVLNLRVKVYIKIYESGSSLYEVMLPDNSTISHLKTIKLALSSTFAHTPDKVHQGPPLPIITKATFRPAKPFEFSLPHMLIISKPKALVGSDTVSYFSITIVHSATTLQKIPLLYDRLSNPTWKRNQNLMLLHSLARSLAVCLAACITREASGIWWLIMKKENAYHYWLTVIMLVTGGSPYPTCYLQSVSFLHTASFLAHSK